MFISFSIPAIKIYSSGHCLNLFDPFENRPDLSLWFSRTTFEQSRQFLRLPPERMSCRSGSRLRAKLFPHSFRRSTSSVLSSRSRNTSYPSRRFGWRARGFSILRHYPAYHQTGQWENHKERLARPLIRHNINHTITNTRLLLVNDIEREKTHALTELNPRRLWKRLKIRNDPGRMDQCREQAKRIQLSWLSLDYITK